MIENDEKSNDANHRSFCVLLTICESGLGSFVSRWRNGFYAITLDVHNYLNVGELQPYPRCCPSNSSK